MRAMRATGRRVAVSALLAGILTVSTVGLAAPAGAKTSDKQIAQFSLISSGDLPAGWTATKANDGSEALKLAKQFPACKTYVAYDKVSDANGKVRSPDFDKGSGSLWSTSTVYRNDAAATKALNDLQSGDVATCLTSILQKGVDDLIAKGPKASGGITKAKATIVEVQVDQQLGDDAAAYSGGLVMTTADGTQSSLITGTIFVRVGRVLNSYSFQSSEAETDAVSTVLAQVMSSSLLRTSMAQG